MSAEGGAVVVWCGPDGLHSQPFQSTDEAERFSRTCDAWALVVTGTVSEFAGSVSIGGDYPFPAFGGEV